MSTITIIQGNNNDKDNTKAYMVKGEKGVSPTINFTEDTGTVDINVTDYTGTHSTTISDPIVSVTKSNHVATISVTDKNGTRTTTVADGADLTDGAVPTGSVMGFDGETIPEGYEEINGLENYSTTEQKIGTWINGKPLYRKVIEKIVDSNTTDRYYLTDLGIINADLIIVNIGKSTAHYSNEAGQEYSPVSYYVSSTDRSHVFIDNYKRLAINNISTAQRTYYITLEYTKTTD